MTIDAMAPPVPLQGTLFARRRALPQADEPVGDGLAAANAIAGALRQREAEVISARLKPGVFVRCRRWTLDHYAQVLEVYHVEGAPQMTAVAILDQPSLAGVRERGIRTVDDLVDVITEESDLPRSARSKLTR